MKALKTFSSPAALVARLDAAAAAMAGRRGVVKARALAERVRRVSLDHARQCLGFHTVQRAQRSQSQIDRGRANRAAMLLDIAQGRPRQAAGVRFEQMDEAVRHFRPAIVSPAVLSPGSAQVALAAGWWMEACQSESTDWDKYSKAWHRAHGPAVEITDRRVIFSRWNGDDGFDRRVVLMSGWRGQWWLAALLDAGIVSAVTVPVKLRGVQLHRAFGVEFVRRVGKVEFYRRTLGGTTYDYAVLCRGLSAHGDSPRAALAILRQKARAIVAQRMQPVDMALCRSLGFCETGVLAFCHDFGLDPAGVYTGADVRAAVRAGVAAERAAVAPYVPELRILASALALPAAELVP